MVQEGRGQRGVWPSVGVSQRGRGQAALRGWDSPSAQVRIFSSVQSLSHVQLFATPWTAARQASLFITNSQSLLKLMSIELVMASNHLIIYHPLLPPSVFPSIRVFPKSQLVASGGQSIGVSASASVLPMNIQDRFPLGWTAWISLLTKCGPLEKGMANHFSLLA